MIYNLTETQGPYIGLNLIDADVTSEDEVLRLEVRFGKDYENLFGDELVDKMHGEKLVSITLVFDDDDIADLMTDEDDEIYDKNSTEYDKDAQFIPVSKGTPKTYKYRLAEFYVHVKKHIKTQKEQDYFRGIGHTLLCWVLDKLNINSSEILALEASGDGDQKGLVEFYKKIGFKTCGNISKMADKWWESSSASGICMYTTIGHFKRICSVKERKFIGTLDEPFKKFESFKN